MAVNGEFNKTSWGNTFLPKESGLKQSDTFGGVSFTGRYASYTKADTWYIIYASDSTMYSSWTDGSVNGEGGGSPKPRCGKILGNDPLDLSVSVVGGFIDHNGGGGKFGFGRYPCAQLMYNDIWYYGTYLLEQNDCSMSVPNSDWPILQPFIGFRVSENFGQDWCDETTPDSPLFENAHDKWVNAHNVAFNPFEVMIGAPHFVDFGQNMEYAPVDAATGRKWAYMVAHGADAGSDLSHVSWVSGDNIYLLRILMPEGRDVKANSEYINDASNWQYYAKDGSYKAWNRDNLQEVYANIKPIVDATGYMGNVGLTYNAPLKKFIMALSRVDDASFFNTMILESDAIDSEYKVVQYMKGFASASYFMNIPSRFISSDGKTMWLCYSSNYFPHLQMSVMGGSFYALCLSEITLDDRHEALGNKYEAEGMKRLEKVNLDVDKSMSNGAGVKEITRLGEGVEFCSKSNGNALGIAVGRSGAYTKRISAYVNDQFVSKFVIMPSADNHDFSLQYIPLNVAYGDKVTLKIDHDDIAYNRMYGQCSAEGAPVVNPSDHIWGNLDYAVVDKVDFQKPNVNVKKNVKTSTFVVDSPEKKECSLIIRYLSEMNDNANPARHLVLEVNKGQSRTLDFVPANGPSDCASVVVPVTLKKGKNVIRLSNKGFEDEGQIEVEGVGQTDFIAYSDGIVKVEFKDGWCDACDMKLRGTAKVMDVHPGYSGKGFVAGLDGIGTKASVSFVPDVEEGEYELGIVYSAGPLDGTTLADKRVLTLSVGDEVYPLELELTESWTEWKEKKIRVHLNGEDCVKLSSDRLGDNDDCINIDKFTLSRCK